MVRGMGGWCWRDVRRHLEAAGHAVHTPTLTGVGERQHLISAVTDISIHIDDVVNLIAWEELADVILVGHSYHRITTNDRPLNLSNPSKYRSFTAKAKVKIPMFPLSEYQVLLHSKFKELQKTGLGYRRIAHAINHLGYKTPGGHQFLNTHVFSI